MFEVAENFEECERFSEIDVHLQYWDNITGFFLMLESDLSETVFKQQLHCVMKIV